MHISHRKQSDHIQEPKGERTWAWELMDSFSTIPWISTNCIDITQWHPIRYLDIRTPVAPFSTNTFY